MDSWSFGGVLAVFLVLLALIVADVIVPLLLWRLCGKLPARYDKYARCVKNDDKRENDGEK